MNREQIEELESLKKDYDIVRDLIEDNIKRSILGLEEDKTQELTARQNELLLKVLQVIEFDDEVVGSLEEIIEHSKEQYLKGSSKELKTTLNRENLITIDKISDLLRKGKIPYNEPKAIKLDRRGSKREVTSTVAITWEDLKDLLPDNINDDDIRTISALMTFYVEGNKQVTLNQIYRKKVRNNKANPNKRQQEKLKKQLSKLNKTYITIECSEEKHLYKYEDLLTEYEGHMLSLDIYTGYIKGNKTTEVVISSISPLFQYAIDKNQYIKQPYAASENQLSKTENTLRLEDYLFKRVTQMKNRNNKLKIYSITVDTIIKNMNFNYKSKSSLENAISRLNKDTEEILKGFIKNDFIKDYNPVSKGNRRYYKWEISI